MDRRFRSLDMLDAALVRELQRTGTIAGAAEACGMGQSGATTRLKRLEKALGFKIAERDYTGANLTPEGEHLAEHCARVLRSLDQLIDELDA